MDSLKFTTIAHGGMAVGNPLGDDVLDDTLAVLAQRLPALDARVLDIGCGKAELLLRLAERYGVDGVGVDSNPAFVAAAREEATLRLPHGARDGALPAGVRGARHAHVHVRPREAIPGVNGDGPIGHLTLHGTSFAEYAASRPPGSPAFDAVLCVGTSHAVGRPREVPARLAPLLTPGGALLVGERFWRREPAPEYLAALGAGADDYTDHVGNRELGADVGLTCVHAVDTSFEDFERYERRFARAIEAFVAAHPGDPDGPVLLQRVRERQAAFRRWGRDTLGFGLYLFIAP